MSLVDYLFLQLRSSVRRQLIKPLSDLQKRLMGCPLHLLLIELVVGSPVQCAPYSSVEFLFFFIGNPITFTLIHDFFMICIPYSSNYMYIQLLNIIFAIPVPIRDFHCACMIVKILHLAGKWGARVFTASKQLLLLWLELELVESWTTT